jgi:uncharacterized protein (DUF952 family)
VIATIYKILSAKEWREAERGGVYDGSADDKRDGAKEWREAERGGVYDGSADDKRDGFIHFSTAEQTLGTYEKYFNGKPDLMLAAIDAAALGAALKWEPSRGGALFPHLYGSLPLSAVRWSRVLASVNDVRQLGQ